MASACGWLAASLSLFLISLAYGSDLSGTRRVVALPYRDELVWSGHFTGAEWIALAVAFTAQRCIDRPAPTRRTFEHRVYFYRYAAANDPYLHLSPYTSNVWLMVATGLLVSAYILQADFRRRESLNAPDYRRLELAGIAGALIPFLNLSNALIPGRCSLAGFAWFGGFLGLCRLLILGRREKIPTLFSGRIEPRRRRGLRYRAHRVSPQRRRRLRDSHQSSLGHELSERRRSYDRACSSHSALRIFRVDADCLPVVADRCSHASAEGVRRLGVLRLSCSHWHGTLCGRDHSTKPPFVPRHVECPSRERRFRLAWHSALFLFCAAK